MVANGLRSLLKGKQWASPINEPLNSTYLPKKNRCRYSYFLKFT